MTKYELCNTVLRIFSVGVVVVGGVFDLKKNNNIIAYIVYVLHTHTDARARMLSAYVFPSISYSSAECLCGVIGIWFRFFGWRWHGSFHINALSQHRFGTVHFHSSISNQVSFGVKL